MANINDVTLLISTIATSAGTIFGIGLSVYTIKRKEAQHLRIDVREHQRLLNPLQGYDPDKEYTNLRVINDGGRPIKISTAGYSLLNYTAGGIFSDSLHNSQTIPVDDVADYLGDETDRPNRKIAYYYATTMTGKTCKKYMTFRGIVFARDLLHKLHIYKKKDLPKAKSKTGK